MDNVHRHTDACLKYAAQTGQPHCIAECRDSYRAQEAEVARLRGALSRLIPIDLPKLNPAPVDPLYGTPPKYIPSRVTVDAERIMDARAALAAWKEATRG